MYTGIRELLVETANEDPVVRSLGLAKDAVYRADSVYDAVDHDEFIVLRFMEPTDRMGDTLVTPYEILGYAGAGNTDRMKKICEAVRFSHERLQRTTTGSGHFTLAEFVGIGADQYDVGYQSMVLVTRMRCVGSGY